MIMCMLPNEEISSTNSRRCSLGRLRLFVLDTLYVFSKCIVVCTVLATCQYIPYYILLFHPFSFVFPSKFIWK